MTMTEERWISLSDAATEVNVEKGALNYYITALKLEKQRFPFDKNAYLSYADFEKIKTLLDQKRQRKGNK